MALHRSGHQHTRRAAGAPGCPHRAHARVEDRIRCAKDAGLGRFPSRQYRIYCAWLAAVMIAADLIGTQTMLCTTTHRWLRPNPRRCATGCCTSPPNSPAGDAGYGYGWTGTGAGAIDLARAFARVAALPQPAS
jgi:hypothetical protein